MDNLEIRKCEKERINDLLDFARQCFINSFSHLNDSNNFNAYVNKAFTVDGWTAEMNHPDSEFYILFSSNQIAGYTKLNKNKAQSDFMGEGYMEIERIYISEHFQNRGYGSSLIDHAISKGKEAGLEKLWLGVWEKNLAAIRFYEKMGFTHVKEHDFYLGDERQTDWIMVLNLNNYG